MKKLAPVLLAGMLLLSACGAEPDTAPLATPTPELTAGAEETPAPQNGKFYALERWSSTFNGGDAYYEFTQKIGYCLLLKTDYATAVQTVCCEIPGCAHDTEDCPAYFPGRAEYCTPFTAGGQLYALNAPAFYFDAETLTWEKYYEEYATPQFTNPDISFAGLTQQEIENHYRGMWQQQTTAMRLYTVHPAGSNTYLDFPKECLDAVFNFCDGEALYGFYYTGVSGRDTVLYRASLADGSVKTLPMEPTEDWRGLYDGALLTMRYVTDAPLPDDWEQYMAAIQSATVEFDRYDPRTGERRKLAERPYDEKAGNDSGYAGTYNGKLYFSGWSTDGTAQSDLIQYDPADGSTVKVWENKSDNNVYMSYTLTNDLPPCDHSTERWIWLYNNGSADRNRSLLDTETFAITPITQKIKNSAEGIGVYLRAQTSDGRWLIVTENGRNLTPSAYGLISPEALAAGSTDWTPVTMYTSE